MVGLGSGRNSLCSGHYRTKRAGQNAGDGPESTAEPAGSPTIDLFKEFLHSALIRRPAVERDLV
jgi:hypothetical protein